MAIGNRVMTIALVLLLLIAGFIAAVYVHDIKQTQRTILRNFPVVGHLRYFSESFGEYMRQYQYLPDWVERPFNRLERAWIYRTAKGISNLVSFGSETAPPFAFRPAAFPILDEERADWTAKRIGVSEGPGACREPYDPPGFFNISGMSYGALSHAAVSALSRGAKMAGVWLATGEGGLAKYHLEGGCDVVMQIGTAKYGVRDEHGNLSDSRLREIAAHPQVRMFEVKLAQGAKPGKGGILPAAKVTAEIAAIRGIPVGQPSISPNRHMDIASIAELGAFVARVRRVTGKPVRVKFVVGHAAFLDEWFADCVANPAHCPDYVQVDGGEGGTGAAPAPLADYVGLPIHPGAADGDRGAGAARVGRAYSHPGLGQAGDAGQGGLGDVHGGGFRFLGARVHICAGVHPGDEVRQRPLPHRSHLGRSAADPRAGPDRQGGAGDALRPAGAR